MRRSTVDSIGGVAIALLLSSGAVYGQVDSVSQLVCAPSSLNSGVATTCTVTLNEAAPTGGTEVLLSSNNSLLSAPANSVTVPAGATSTTFTATAGSVSSNQSVTLTATALNSVLLSWTASTSPNITNYNVYRGVTSGGPYSVVTSVGLVTTYVDSNIQNGQNYYYVTTAVNSAGEESAYSNQASAAVLSGVSQTATVSLVAPAPTVSSVAPNSGSTAGGTAVTITGANFASGATVTFGGAAATNVVVASSTSITATTPAGSAGAALVTVTVSGQSGSLASGFTYLAPPVITSRATAIAVVGVPFSYQITATNSPSSYGATGLPAGLNLNGATGLISGTPSTVGRTTVSLSATSAGGTGTSALTLTIISSYFVQITSKATGASQSLSVSFPQNTGSGNLIMVGFGFMNNVTPVSVTDTQGNTFIQVGVQLNSPGGAGSRVYYANNIRGGADTVTIALSGSSGLDAYLTEYSGLSLASPIDGQAGSAGGVGAVSSGSVATTVAGDLIYGFCIGDSTCTAGLNFTARSTYNGNLVEDEKAGNPGPYAATGTADSGWTMQMVALKPQ